MRKVLVYPYSDFSSIDSMVQSDLLIRNLTNDLSSQCLFEILKINYLSPISSRNVDLIIIQRLDLKIYLYLVISNLISKTIYIAYEPYTVLPLNHTRFIRKLSRYFLRIYSMDDSLSSLQNITRLNTPTNLTINDISIDSLEEYNSRKLLTQISSNKFDSSKNSLYSLRAELNDFFCKNSPEMFRFFGRGWKSSSLCYGGEVDNKVDILKQFRFNVCFENTNNIPGYISEKIFDSFMGSCVPIYYGAPNVKDHIPENCFVDFRDFRSKEELLQFIVNMDFSTYRNYIVNIRSFIASEEYTKTNLDSLVFSMKSLIRNKLNSANTDFIVNKLLDKLFFLALFVQMLFIVFISKLRFYYEHLMIHLKGGLR
jgi:alpha(1,3/1,4) fucosyltransferase